MPTSKFFEIIIPSFCLALSVAIFTPIVGIVLWLPTALKIHILSFLALGILFELPELSLNIFCFWLARTESTLMRNFVLLQSVLRTRYVLTHFVGPCSGIMVIASGLYLVDVGGRSLREAWLFWIIVAATVGLYKGMTQHNFYVKYLLQVVNAHDEKSIAAVVGRARQIIYSPFDHSLIFLELPTYVFIYFAAYFKPAWPNPLEWGIRDLEYLVGNPALVGVGIVGAGGLLIRPLRWSMRKFSRTFSLS